MNTMSDEEKEKFREKFRHRFFRHEPWFDEEEGEKKESENQG